MMLVSYNYYSSTTSTYNHINYSIVTSTIYNQHPHLHLPLSIRQKLGQGMKGGTGGVETGESPKSKVESVRSDSTIHHALSAG